VAAQAEAPSQDAAERALELIEGEAPLVLVHGGAGTGKTTFLQRLRKHDGKRQVFVAPTGVAALNVGGQTIHSFFGLPPRLLNRDEIKPRPFARRLMRKLDRLVVDEVSMARADLVDAMDLSLRLARNRDEPFGGVQVVLVGDFLQLAPVVPVVEQEILAGLGYEGPYAFHARVLAGAPVAGVGFTTVHRQSDATFVSWLDALRRGRDVERAVAALNEACVGSHREGRAPVLLAGTNARVDAYNAEGMARLATPEVGFAATTAGEFGLAGDRLPVPERLALKVGARVMAVRNDAARRYVNGSTGTVVGLGEGGARVRFDSGVEMEIEPETWERIRYEADETGERIVSKVVGSYTQLPLVPAWAVTIHKAQGLTLEDVRIDLGYAFAPGQTYVALSRARSLAGLSLVQPLRPRDIRVDPRVVAFVEALERG
jgi:ATP-dependent exoDNAse (exonuclease V) alpha subunit